MHNLLSLELHLFKVFKPGGVLSLVKLVAVGDDWHRTVVACCKQETEGECGQPTPFATEGQARSVCI